MYSFARSHLWSLATFAVISIIGYVARNAIGSVYSTAEAIALLNALSRAGLYLASAIATASATTMALMLTLIGLLRRMDKDFDAQAYRNVDLVARLSTASLLLSLLLLMAFTFPVGEFEDMPAGWFDALYDVLFFATVVTIGLAGATVVLIYTTLRSVTEKITPGEEV